MSTVCFKKEGLGDVHTALSQSSGRFEEDGWREGVFRKSCKVGEVALALYIGKITIILQCPQNQVTELKNEIAHLVKYAIP